MGFNSGFKGLIPGWSRQQNSDGGVDTTNCKEQECICCGQIESAGNILLPAEGKRGKGQVINMNAITAYIYIYIYIYIYSDTSANEWPC